MKIALVSANFGDFDSKHPIIGQSVDCDYYFYDDSNFPFPMSELNPRMKSRYVKWQMHKILSADYDVFIWIDSSFTIKSKDFVKTLIEELEKPYVDFVIRKHPERNCIFDEANFIANGMLKGNRYLIERYLNSDILKESVYYLKYGHPIHNGLWACGMFARRNTHKSNHFSDEIWESCLKWSHFDQNSFAFLARKRDMIINTTKWSPYMDNELYTLNKHK